MLQRKLAASIAGQEGYIIPGKDVGVFGGHRQTLPGIKDPQIRAELRVLIEQQKDFQRAKRFYLQDPLNGGVRAAGQKLSPKETRQRLGIDICQARQVIPVFFADVLADLGFPAAAGLEMP
jgi:hypothetical protein